ncbi:MAG TPA: sugar ABC transporter permease [bacterium]|nr:sugar ABC transporter permease [bacterium]
MTLPTERAIEARGAARGSFLRRTLAVGGYPAFFLGPAVVVVLLLFLVPAVLTVVISLTNLSVATGLHKYRYIGIGNYAQITHSPWLVLVLKNTMIYMLSTLSLFNVGLALMLALLTAHLSGQAPGVFRVLWMLPRITPSVIYALMWRWFAAQPPYGTLSQILGWAGVPGANWMNVHPWAFIVALNGFVGASFGMIIFSSAIAAIPHDQYLAADVDGASPWQQVWRITLPRLRWPILFVTAYQTLSLLTSFEYILLTTNGGPGFYTTEVWSLYAFHLALSNYFGNTQFGLGAALAAVLVVLGLAASAIYLRLFRFGELVAAPKIEVN